MSDLAAAVTSASKIFCVQLEIGFDLRRGLLNDLLTQQDIMRQEWYFNKFIEGSNVRIITVRGLGYRLSLA